MRVPRLSPIAYRRVTIVAAVLLAIIIVTGAAVRLSNSGLGVSRGRELPEEPAPGARPVERARHHRAPQPALHRPRVGRRHPRGARQPAPGPEAAGPDLAVLGPGGRRLRAGDPRPAHGRVRPQAAVRDGALPGLDPPAQRRARPRTTIRPTRRARPHRGEPSHGGPGSRARRSGHVGALHRHDRDRSRSAQRRRQAPGRRPSRPEARDRGARAQRDGLDLPRRGAHDAVVATPRSRTTRDPPTGDAAARAPRRAGRDRLHPVLQRHPRVPGRRARGRRDRGVERDADAPPGDVRTHARAHAATRARPTPCLHPPEAPGKLVRCRRRSASTGRGTSA